MRYGLLVISVLSLVGCHQTTQDLGFAGKNPGMLVCGGAGSISINGQAMVYAGSGMVTFSCGQGAYFGQGFPAANLPLVPSLEPTPKIPSMPPLGPMPPAGP